MHCSYIDYLVILHENYCAGRGRARLNFSGMATGRAGPVRGQARPKKVSPCRSLLYIHVHLAMKRVMALVVAETACLGPLH